MTTEQTPLTDEDCVIQLKGPENASKGSELIFFFFWSKNLRMTASVMM